MHLANNHYNYVNALCVILFYFVYIRQYTLIARDERNHPSNNMSVSTHSAEAAREYSFIKIFDPKVKNILVYILLYFIAHVHIKAFEFRCRLPVYWHSTGLCQSALLEVQIGANKTQIDCRHGR